jgi:hypothetical protein
MTTSRLRLLPALAFAFAASAVHAQDAGDDDKQALRAFSDAYGIVELWPRMAPKIARDSLPRLREAAFADLAADLAADPLADPGARARAEARLDGLVTRRAASSRPRCRRSTRRSSPTTPRSRSTPGISRPRRSAR